MAAAQPAEPTAWIAVSPDTDPLVQAHIEHAAGQVVGETHNGDDWREALAWARARTDRVYLRFDDAGATYWAGAGPPPDRDPPLERLPERPLVAVDAWIAELQASGAGWPSWRRRPRARPPPGRCTRHPGTGRSARSGSAPPSRTASPPSGRR